MLKKRIERLEKALEEKETLPVVILRRGDEVPPGVGKKSIVIMIKRAERRVGYDIETIGEVGGIA